MAKDKKKASEIAEASEETKSTFRDLRVEFKNVTWPTKQTVITNTSVVLSVIVIGSAFIGLLDTGLLELVKFLIGLSQK